jgi:hypothetical protein
VWIDKLKSWARVKIHIFIIFLPFNTMNLFLLKFFMYMFETSHIFVFHYLQLL